MQPEPTDEQAQIVAAIEAGDNVAVDALAGSGKTFALLLGAQAKERRLKRGRYVSFGKGNRQDAIDRFPATVECHTSHSLAWEVGKYYQRRWRPKDSGRTGAQLAEAFGTKPCSPTPDRPITAIGVAVAAKEAVGRYARSAARTLEPWHVAAPPGLDGPALKAFRAHVLPYAKQMWADLHDPHADRAEFTHDHYRKMWALKKPRLDRDCDFIMLDEAQDTDALTRSVLLDQNCQLIAVGDAHQTLYSWRGGSAEVLAKWPADQRLSLSECQPEGTIVQLTHQVNGREWSYREVPIEQIKVGDTVVTWTSKRGLMKRGCRVNDVSTRRLDGPVVTVEAGGFRSRYALNHHCVVMPGHRPGVQVVYMMRRNGQFRIGRSPWAYEEHGARAFGPKFRAKRDDADAFWILSVHDDPAEASLAEALAQHEFNIPGQTFIDQKSYRMDLDAFWSKVGDNSAAAESCLRQHGRLITHPLWERSTPYNWVGTRVLVTAAANLMDGMHVAVLDESRWSGTAWAEARVRREWYTGTIYSLSVERDHTYVADGIVTHNSFRFGPEIAEAANAWLEVLDEPLRLTGRGEPGTVGPLTEVDVVLCRTNAGAIAAAAEALTAGRRVGMARSVLDRIKKMCQAAMQLQSGQACDDPLLATFASWPEVVQYVRLDPTMGELAMLVRMVERFGAAELYRIVRHCKDAARAKTDLVVMTVHQSKGLQWPRVRVGDDFPAPALDADGAVQAADAALLQLCYVACTRASSGLDNTALDWIDAYRKGEATETQLERWYERELRKAGERD